MANDGPCRHLDDFAAVTNFHDGHCCFWPSSQNCHQSEVAEWERRAHELRIIPADTALLSKRPTGD